MHAWVHPSVIDRWKRARFAAACGVHAGCGGSEPDFESREGGGFNPGYAAGFEGGQFGVRRPLRFLAYKLGLSEPQVTEMARILSDLKTERAQSAVDDRRALTLFADALTGETFDGALAAQGTALRKQEAERLADAVAKALARIHGLLDPAQRERFAYLMRTGALQI